MHVARRYKSDKMTKMFLQEHFLSLSAGLATVPIGTLLEFS